MAHILRTVFHQDSNVGLFGFATDTYGVLTSGIDEKTSKKVSEVLGVKMAQTLIAGTQLVGAFCAGNNNKLLLPQLVFESELKRLDKAKIDYEIIETDHTALGNNILATDEKALISLELKKHEAQIKKALGVKEIKTFQIEDMTTIGSLAVLNKNGCLLTRLASAKEKKFVEDFFGLPATLGTVNLGSPYVRSGIIANSHGFVFGSHTGGPEATHIDEALGFLKK